MRQILPEREWSHAEHLLASLVDGVHVLIWQQTADGHKGRNYPKPLRRPGDVEDPEQVADDRQALTVSDLNRALQRPRKRKAE